MSVDITSAIFSTYDPEPEHRKIIEQVAALIAPRPHGWILEFLTNQSFDVRLDECIDSMSPNRAKVVSSFSRIEALLEKLHREFEFLNNHGFLQDGLEPGTSRIATISSLVRQMRISPLLVTNNGRIRRGAGRARQPGQTSAKIRCAAVISEAWAYFHDGKYPSATNVHACKAAELLFTSHIASRRQSWGNAPNGWKRYFSKMDRPELQDVRKEIRRVLALQSRHTSMELN